MFLLVLTSSAFAAPLGDATGTISGAIVEGTAGAKLAAGTVVTLDGMSSSQRPLPERSATVDAQGKFSFEGVPVDPGSAYAVSTTYAGVAYHAAVDLKNGVAPPTTLTVYELTTSDKALKISSAYWVLAATDPTNQQVTLLETLTVVNGGDRTYVGDHRGDPGTDAPGILLRTISLPLPQGASDFTPVGGIDQTDVLPVANGYVETTPVTPGEHEIVYHYLLAYADGAFELSKALPYPADHLIFLAPDGGLDLRSDRLGSGGTTQIDGKTYDVLGADNVPANQNVNVDVLGLPSSPTTRVSPDTLRLVAVGVSVPLLLIALAFGLRRGRRGRGNPAAERASLVAALAQLDDRFQAGQIEPERYETERANQKRALLELMLREPATASRGGS